MIDDRNDVALQLTLKLLDNFAYQAKDFGGSPLKEQAQISGELATIIFNAIHSGIDTSA